MEGDSLAQLSVAQENQAQFSLPGQPIMYQFPPGQQQPVFVQVPPGQSATTPDGRPIQYYYGPVMQPGQQGQPGQPAQLVQPGQQMPPVQPGQPVQPVFVQGPPAQPAVQPQQVIDTDFLKSPRCYIKIAEFVSTVFSLM